MPMYIKKLLLFISILLTMSCRVPSSDITSLQEEIFNEQEIILCPKVNFIEDLDRLTVSIEKKETYNLKFNEVKWKCYSETFDANNKADNIDLSISFKVDYIDTINDFKIEKFNFIVVLLNKDNVIISKKKFSRSFLSSSSSEIISNNNALISIKVKNSYDEIYDHRLLLGFIKN